CVNPSLPVKSISELIAYIKANPNAVSFGSSGSGGATHLAGELFKIQAGVPMLHVPYKGSNPAMMDLLGGQIQVMFADSASAIPQMKAGRVRALAVGSSNRSTLYPDVPTLVEEGFKNYLIESWGGIVAPARTPVELVDRLNADINRVLADPDLQARYAELGAEVRMGPPDLYAKEIQDGIARWAQVIQTAGIKAG